MPPTKRGCSEKYNGKQDSVEQNSKRIARCKITALALEYESHVKRIGNHEARD